MIFKRVKVKYSNDGYQIQFRIENREVNIRLYILGNRHQVSNIIGGGHETGGTENMYIY